jgi:hypothetical protein
VPKDRVLFLQVLSVVESLQVLSVVESLQVLLVAAEPHRLFLLLLCIAQRRHRLADSVCSSRSFGSSRLSDRVLLVVEFFTLRWVTPSLMILQLSPLMARQNL